MDDAYRTLSYSIVELIKSAPPDAQRRAAVALAALAAERAGLHDDRAESALATMHSGLSADPSIRQAVAALASELANDAKHCQHEQAQASLRHGSHDELFRAARAAEAIALALDPDPLVAALGAAYAARATVPEGEDLRPSIVAAIWGTTPLNLRQSRGHAEWSRAFRVFPYSLVESMLSAPPDILRKAAASLAALGTDRTGLDDDRVTAALTALQVGRPVESAERQSLEAFVDELDEAAWRLRNNGDQPGDLGPYFRAFAKARAAEAVALALEPDPLHAALEAAYATAAAIGNRQEVESLLADVLQHRDDQGGRSGA